ncbi:alpha/beta fold hydrolase [Paracraurococcus ruber]|nr:alpha/beta hydrolase [Paracraurococcus ruber]TDG33104.1 alpha/beta hydrolase [Paracraurococcus ruber]
MTPDRILALVLALTAPPPAEPLFPVIAAGGADPRYPVVAAACPRPLAPFEVEGVTVACGKVSVPENHAAPSGRRIDLTFMIFRSRSLAPAPDAVVQLHGGPGIGVVANVAQTSTYFEELRARRDVVAFDQRGVDASAAAGSRCFATLAANADGLVQASRGLGDRLALTRAMTRDCLAEIRASGADISMINTGQNARDVGAVMRTLGYPAYNIYGLSYGTKLAQEVMRAAPEGLRAVVLDSVAPVQAAIYDTLALPFAESIQSVFDACRADAGCDAAYPDLRRRFWALWPQLTAAPIETPEGRVTPDALFQLFEDRNNYRRNLQGLTGYIPRIVAELEQGNPATFVAAAHGRLPLHPTPEAALAGLSGLDAEARALAEAALRLAQMGRLNDQAVALLLERLEASRAAAAAGTRLVDTFEAALRGAAQALPARPRRLAFASDYLRLRAAVPTREALAALLARHFDGETQQRLAVLAGMLDAGQLAQVFARISRDNAGLDHVLLAGFQTQMFACQEDLDINSRPGAAAVNARIRAEYGWPESLTATFEQMLETAFYAPCEEFTRHPRPGFHDPVTAAIPTLVLQGAMDVQTAPSWGALAARSLPRGRLVFFPETGHGTLAFSKCARDIGVAFLENPEAVIDTRCTAALVPSFVLPDGRRSR